MQFDELDTLLISLAMLLLGGLIGHKLALGRDKRKEFNNSMIQIRKKLINKIPVSKSDIDDLEIHVGGESSKIRVVFEKYYLPTLSLCTGGGVDDDGIWHESPLTQEEIDDILSQKEIARKKLLDACKFK